MKKLGKLAAVLCLCVLFLAGCGEAKLPDVIDTQTISVNGDGKITIWLVGEFEDVDINVTELTAQAVEEVAQFNAEKGTGTDAVAVEKVEELSDSGRKVVVTYKFDGWKNCTDFIGNKLFYGNNELFYGTVEEALGEGYGSQVILKNVKDNTLLTEGQLKQETEKSMIVTDMKANVYCPGKVTYITDGAVLNEDGSVDTTSVEGLVYILLK